MPEFAREVFKSIGRKTMTSTLARFDDLDKSCLVIPEGLADFADANVVMKFGKNAIFHKLIKSQALDVEFYNNMPCLCFVMSGQETFITPCGTEIVVNANEMILISQGGHMISNFYNKLGNLEAFLFFFDEDLIAKFKQQIQKRPSQSILPKTSTYKISSNKSLSGFMNSLLEIYNCSTATNELLNLKLFELLHLIQAINKSGDTSERFESFLDQLNLESGRRNIRYVMRHHFSHNLKVKDYAKLTGRSVSAFNREFKRQFNISPSHWLIARRLEAAYELLVTTQMQVTEIALEVGYDNTSHFISMFKHRYGVTPKHLQKSIL